METVKVDILNPKARKLLKELADLDLIAICESSKSGFSDVLKNIRYKSENVPSSEEIAKEVTLIRAWKKN